MSETRRNRRRLLVSIALTITVVVAVSVILYIKRVQPVRADKLDHDRWAEPAQPREPHSLDHEASASPTSGADLPPVRNDLLPPLQWDIAEGADQDARYLAGAWIETEENHKRIVAIRAAVAEAARSDVPDDFVRRCMRTAMESSQDWLQTQSPDFAQRYMSFLRGTCRAGYVSDVRKRDDVIRYHKESEDKRARVQDIERHAEP
jgi:hypothetical protein